MTRIAIALGFVSLLLSAPVLAGEGCPYSKDHQVTTAETSISTSEPAAEHAAAKSCGRCRSQEAAHAKADGANAECVCRSDQEERLTVAAD